MFVTFEELVDEVGKDSARFFFLMITPETHMDFDMSLAKERTLKNPVFYVQYAAVRAKSIMRKVKKPAIPDLSDLAVLSTEEDIRLMKTLAQFPEIILSVSSSYNIRRLTQYALELAKVFHGFYEKERVLGEEKNVVRARLTLISATLIVFKNLFSVLGISFLKKM